MVNINIKTLETIIVVWTVLGIVAMLADVISGYDPFINLLGVLYSGSVIYYVCKVSHTYIRFSEKNGGD